MKRLPQRDRIVSIDLPQKVSWFLDVVVGLIEPTYQGGITQAPWGVG